MTNTVQAPALGTVLDELLRDRKALFARLTDDAQLADVARAFIAITAVSAAVFGASVGAYRGGIQILFAAIKVPLVLLLTAAICAPSWTALRAGLGGDASIKHDLVRVLGGLSMVSVVLAALAPFLLVGVVVRADYHSMSLFLFGCAAVAGFAGVVVLVRSRSGRAMVTPLLLFVTLFMMVGAQMSWTLRPYLVRPRTTETPFVRSLEGNVIEAAGTSLDSARGIYVRESAPLPGEDLEEGSWQ